MNKSILTVIFTLGLLNLKILDNSSLIPYFFSFIQLLIFLFYLTNGRLFVFEILSKKTKRLIIFFVSLFYFSLLRADPFSLLIFITFITQGLFLTAYFSEIALCIKNKEIALNQSFQKYIITPFVIYFTINLICYFLKIRMGVSNENEISIGQAMILGSIGISIERVNFLFTNGINSYAVILGCIFSFTITRLLFKVDTKYIIFNFIIIICILLSDSRSAMLYPLLIGIISIFILKAKKFKLIKMTPIIFFIAPLTLIAILPLLQNATFLEQFARNSTDFMTLNGRLFIWYFALEELTNFKLIHLIGYGYFGHYTSGVSLKWSFLFSSYINPDNAHPHNSILSLIFDIGYIGVLALFLVLRKVSRSLIKIWEIDAELCVNIFSILVFFTLISISESFIGLFYQNSMTIFISLILFVTSIEAMSEEILLQKKQNKLII